jgi:hypothetical protein
VTSVEPDLAAAAAPGNASLPAAGAGADAQCRELSERLQAARWTRADWHAFLTLWDKAVGTPGYDKAQWKDLERRIQAAIQGEYL